MNVMKTDSGKTVSPWLQDFEMPAFAPLNRDIKTDVCVIGAGIVGVSVAYHLSKQGKAAVLIDDGDVGGGETGRTTAHLASALDDRYYDLEKIHGERGSQLAAESHSKAIDQIEENALVESIQCDFQRVDGYLFGPPQDGLEIMERELEAARRAGLDVEMIDHAPLPFDTGPALRFLRQGQFHPLKYLKGLAAAIERRGGQVFSGTHACEIKGGKHPQVLTTNRFSISAKHVVVATNTPVNDRLLIHTKQSPYRTYVLGFEVEAGAVPVGLYWDNDDPYHYVRLEQNPDRLQEGRDLLMIGGEDHKTGQPEEGEDPFSILESWTRARFQMAGEIQFRWSGQVLEPVDSLAFIGRNPLEENVYIATGHSGNGMTYGAIAGILITDLIAGQENEWEKLYDPRRKSLRGLRRFAGENLNVAGQYGDWAAPGDVKSCDEIPANAGAIIRDGAKKIAAYRDEAGTVHCFSAVCPHLGCVVRWNGTEKTWDCPCHGSRFKADGAVINGPANHGLKEVEFRDQQAEK